MTRPEKTKRTKVTNVYEHVGGGHGSHKENKKRKKIIIIIPMLEFSNTALGGKSLPEGAWRFK